MTNRSMAPFPHSRQEVSKRVHSSSQPIDGSSCSSVCLATICVLLGAMFLVGFGLATAIGASEPAPVSASGAPLLQQLQATTLQAVVSVTAVQESKAADCDAAVSKQKCARLARETDHPGRIVAESLFDITDSADVTFKDQISWCSAHECAPLLGCSLKLVEGVLEVYWASTDEQLVHDPAARPYCEPNAVRLMLALSDAPTKENSRALESHLMSQAQVQPQLLQQEQEKTTQLQRKLEQSISPKIAAMLTRSKTKILRKKLKRTKAKVARLERKLTTVGEDVEQRGAPQDSAVSTAKMLQEAEREQLEVMDKIRNESAAATTDPDDPLAAMMIAAAQSGRANAEDEQVSAVLPSLEVVLNCVCAQAEVMQAESHTHVKTVQEKHHRIRKGLAKPLSHARPDD